jgi:glutathione synthase/RimK-type ligase-like ATP-grasp enzyme
MLAAILRNDFDPSYLNWIDACKKFNIDYKVIELVRSNWLEETTSQEFDIYLCCPPGREELYKKLYDERIYILNKVLGKFVYPDFNEISLHENKKYLSYWLEANKIHHPRTFIFYNKAEAESFAKTAELPIVGKINIGASGKGVLIFRDRKELFNYINRAFNKGIRQEWGPNFKMGSYIQRIKKILRQPKVIPRKFKIYKKNFDALQKGYVLFQEYIMHDFEWRVVKIGESFFGHQKIKQGDKASGTKGIDYIAPSDKLLDFVNSLCEQYGFNSMAIDLFEDEKRGYLINEMQCIFGHVQPYICEMNGNPGRFILKNGEWIFEEGMFNTNLSYDLRLQDAINLFRYKSRK